MGCNIYHLLVIYFNNKLCLIIADLPLQYNFMVEAIHLNAIVVISRKVIVSDV